MAAIILSAAEVEQILIAYAKKSGAIPSTADVKFIAANEFDTVELRYDITVDTSTDISQVLFRR